MCTRLSSNPHAGNLRRAQRGAAVGTTSAGGLQGCRGAALTKLGSLNNSGLVPELFNEPLPCTEFVLISGSEVSRKCHRCWPGGKWREPEDSWKQFRGSGQTTHPQVAGGVYTMQWAAAASKSGLRYSSVMDRKKFAGRFLMGLLVGLLLVSCSESHRDSQIQALQGEVSSLSARVSSLEAAQSRLSAESYGSWILWQRSDIVQTKQKFFLSGPSPARPMDAFSSKQECEQSARQLAESHGGKSGATEYLMRDTFGIDRIFFTCMPKGISIQH